MIATLIAILTCKKPEHDRQLPASTTVIAYPVAKAKSLENGAIETTAAVPLAMAVTPEVSLSSSKEEVPTSPTKKQELLEDAHGNVEASPIPHIISDAAVGEEIDLKQDQLIMSKPSDVPSVHSVHVETAAETAVLVKKGSGLTVEIPPVDDNEDEVVAAADPEDMVEDLPDAAPIQVSKTKSRDSVKSNSIIRHDSKSTDSAAAKGALIIPATSVHSTKTLGELQGVLLNGGGGVARNKAMSSESLQHPDDEFDIPESRPEAKFDEKHIDVAATDSTAKTPNLEDSGSYFFCCA